LEEIILLSLTKGLKIMDLLNKLIQKQHISKEDARLVKEDVQETGRSEEQVLLDMGLVSKEDLSEKEEQPTERQSMEGQPQEEVFLDRIPPEALDLIHEVSAKHYKMIPISRDGNTVKVGMVDPDDLKAQEVLKFIAKQKNVSFNRASITEDDFEKILHQISNEPESKEEPEQKQEESEELATDNEVENKEEEIKKDVLNDENEEIDEYLGELEEEKEKDEEVEKIDLQDISIDKMFLLIELLSQKMTLKRYLKIFLANQRKKKNKNKNKQKKKQK
jgi:hypothetical protein